MASVSSFAPTAVKVSASENEDMGGGAGWDKRSPGDASIFVVSFKGETFVESTERMSGISAGDAAGGVGGGGDDSKYDASTKSEYEWVASPIGVPRP